VSIFRTGNRFLQVVGRMATRLRGVTSQKAVIMTRTVQRQDCVSRKDARGSSVQYLSEFRTVSIGLH
jgi:hypothetical protein